MDEAVVIGGGLAGLAAASELVQADVGVTVLEQEPVLGGRARNMVDVATGDPVPIGPHVFMRGYRNLRRFFDVVGVEDGIRWQEDVFIEFVDDGEWRQAGADAVGDAVYKIPLHGDYDGLNRGQVAKTLWFFLKTRFMRQETVESLDDRTVHQYLVEEDRLPQEIVDRYVTWLLDALLNTPIDECSAAEFLNLVKRFFDASGDSRRFGFADGGLGDIYVDDARRFIEAHGGTVNTDTAVTGMTVTDGAVSELAVSRDGAETMLTPDTVLATTPPTQIRELLPSTVRGDPFFTPLDRFEPVPYISVFLWFDEKITEKPFWALKPDDDADSWNTDFYDKSNLPGFDRENSLIMSNIIDSRGLMDATDDTIVQKTLAELRDAFPDAPDPVHTRVHRIPYAIYRPRPGMRRCKRPHRTPYDNLYLAGDWTISELPQCMEAAVKSGYRGVEAVLADDGVEKQLAQPLR